MAADYLECQGLHDHPLLFGLPEMAHFADFLLRETPKQSVPELYADWLSRRPHGPDLRDDLLYVRDVLVNAGHDVIAVDQTSADQLAVGTHSVCTVVPGLLPIDFGWSKQRALYMPRMRQALRRAGFRDTDLDVLDMNLVPHPFP
jgi:ribosomal protein S12 methylthiotransferase accessory factor